MGQKWSGKMTSDCQEKMPTWPEVNIYYSKLLEIDQRYSQVMKDGMKAFMDLRLTEQGYAEDVRQTVLDSGIICLTGSCADGGGTCRWFKSSMADVELDIMYEVGHVKAENEEDVILWIPEKPGYAKVLNGMPAYMSLHPVLRKNKPELSGTFNTGKPGQSFVDTADMQDEVIKIWPHRDSSGNISQIAASLLEADESELGFLLTEKTEGPSSMKELIICLREEPQVLYSNDNVFTFKLSKWPLIMDEWLTRESRVWQTEKHSVINACFKQGCHLVSKKSPSDVMTNTEWRLSFSYIERILMQSWNSHQMLCYYFLKSLYYRYLRGIEVQSKHIPSYALKTEMFWVIESMDTSHWTEQNLKSNALKVLIKMHEDLKKGNIENYFVTTINIIDPNTYPKELTDKVAAMTHVLIENLEEALPKDLEKMVCLGNEILTNMEAILAYIRSLTMKAAQKQAGLHMSSLEEVLQTINYGVDAVGLLYGSLGNKEQ